MPETFETFPPSTFSPGTDGETLFPREPFLASCNRVQFPPGPSLSAIVKRYFHLPPGCVRYRWISFRPGVYYVLPPLVSPPENFSGVFPRASIVCLAHVQLVAAFYQKSNLLGDCEEFFSGPPDFMNVLATKGEVQLNLSRR